MAGGVGQHGRSTRSRGPFMKGDPRGGPTGTDEPPRTGRWQMPPGGHPWYLAAMAVAAVGLAAGGVTMLAQGTGAPSQQVPPDCGLINCGAILPTPAISTQSHIGKAHFSASHRPAAPAQSAPPPSPAPSQTPNPPPDVTMTLTSDRERHDFDHFRVQLTLVNNGGSPVASWTVQLTLPGDDVFSVETRTWWDGVPFEHWQVSGDTLTISADTGSETLAPGEPLSLSIHGRGSTAFPTGCTFNGAVCPSMDGRQHQQTQEQPSRQQDRRQPPSQDQRSWPWDRQRSW